MQLIIKENHKFISFFSDTIVGFNKYINQIDTVNKKISADLYCNEKKIFCNELLVLKELLINSNIKLTNVYSSSRESIISANSLKMNSIFSYGNFDEFYPRIEDQHDDKDLTHFGMVRSGDQISSNGNLFIIGDVNPGAQISAKKKHFRMGEIMWGRICGEKR